MSATPGIAGITGITFMTPVVITNPNTIAVGAGIVAGDGTVGIIGTAGMTGIVDEFERGFGPFLILRPTLPYSRTISPDPPNSAGKSFSLGRPSRIGNTVSE